MKNRIISILSVIAMLSTLILQFTPFASAESSGTCGEDLMWTYEETTGELRIFGTGTMSNYTTSNRPPWYDYHASIRQIVICEGITHIGEYSFADCSLIHSVTLPEGVVSVGKYAFSGCNLDDIFLPSTLATVYPNAIYSSKNVHILSESEWLDIQWIGEYDFGNYYCYSNPLRNGATLYINNFPISDFVIPEGTTSIPQFAFNGCTTITSITIPSSVTTIGGRAFENCRSLNRVNINDINAYYAISLSPNPNGWNSNDNGKGAAPLQNGADLFVNNQKLTQLVIPEGLSTLSPYLFYGCTSIEKILFPSSPVSLGGYAFCNCTSLSDVIIPSYLNTIPEGLFSGCSSLIDIELPEGVETVGSYAFNGCPLESVTLPSTLTYVGSSAFCGSINEIHIPSIHDWVEIQWSGTMDWGNCYCESNPIRGNSNLFVNGMQISDVIVPYGITSIPQFSFYSSKSICSISLPSSINTIGGRAFQSCTNLHAVYISDLSSFCNISLSPISNGWNTNDGGLGAAPLQNGADLYFGSQKITSLTVPSDCSQISNYLFYGCTSLADVTIPSQVDVIGNYAFDKCQNLERIKLFNPSCSIGSSSIPKSVTIYGFVGLTAESYAISNGNRFVPLLSSDVYWNESSIYLLNGTMPVTVYGNKKNASDIDEEFILLNDATITYSTNTFTTNENGFADFKYEGGPITVSKPGYVARTIPEEAIRKNQTIYLQKESNFPIISGLWVNGQDILHENAEVSLTGKDQFTLIPEISWGSSQPTSISLSQGSTSIQIINGAITLAWSDYFDVSAPIYLVATNTDGLTSKKQLKISAASQLPESLSGLSIEFGDSLSITLPDSVPEFFQGTELSAGIYSNIPIEYTVENGKVYAAIGFQKDYSQSNGKMKAKTFAQSLKDVFKDATDGIDDYHVAQAAMKKWGGYAAVVEGSFGVKTGFKIMGYAEGYLTPEGKVVWLDSGMIIGGNASVGYSFPFYLGPVPMFFEAKLAGSVEARANLYIAPEAKQFTPNVSLSGNVSLSAGLGVGIKDVASVSGGLKGALIPRWDVSLGRTDYFQLKAQLSAYAKVAVLFFEYSKDWTFAESVWYEYPEKRLHQFDTTDERNFEPYNTDNYQKQDVSYLTNGSQFRANNPAVRGAEQSVWLSNSYCYANPQFISFSNGTMLAVWIGMDQTGTANGLRLFASFYNGETWSEPWLIDPDDTMDAAPTLSIIDDVAYLAWQNACEDVSAVESLDELAGMMDVSFAVFDKETQSFEIQRLTNNNGMLDNSPVICGSDSDIYVVWQRNADNDWFGTENNCVVYRCMHQEIWDDEVVVYNGLDSIVSLDADYDGSSLQIAYSVDVDGNLNTTTDLELYENGLQLTEDEAVDSGAQYYEHTLYWYKDGSIVTKDGIILENVPTDRFQMISDGTVKAIVFAEQDGLASILYAAYCDVVTGKWGSPISLTDGETNIASFSAAVANGKVTVLWNSVDVVGDFDNENPYGTANICWTENVMSCDLAVTDVYYDCSEFVDGADMSFVLNVQNNGELAANGLNVVLTDADGNVLSSVNYADVILSGTSCDISFAYKADMEYYGKKLTITVLPFDGEDTHVDDNSTTADIAFHDFSVENMSWGYNETGEIVVFADIVNRSYEGTSEIVTVGLYKDTLESVPLQTLIIDGLGSLELQHAAFTIDGMPASAVYFIAISAEDSNERKGNDSDYVLVSFDDPNDLKPNPFVDVIEGKYYYTPVLWAYYHDPQITSGTSGTSFSPNATCTRAQIVTFLWRAAGSPEPKTTNNPFADVKPDKYYYKAVLWAAEAGVTSGTSDKNFSPNDGCTRAQVVTFLWRFAGSPEPTTTTNPFTDVPAEKYYTKAVLWAAEKGVTAGTSATTFSPNQTCTRAQIVTFLYRYMEG